MRNNRTDTRNFLGGALAVLAMLSVIVGISFGLTAVSMHTFNDKCHADNGVITTKTFAGLPVESMCHYE